MSSRKVREHSVQRVLQILDWASRWAADELPGQRLKVSINDDNFSIDARRMREILDAVRNRQYPNIYLWAELRVDSLLEVDFELMAEAGLREINVGLDTAADAVIRSAKKIVPRSSDDQSYFRERAYVVCCGRAVTG
jgi:hypothetical protein